MATVTIKIKIAHRTLRAIERAYVTTIALRELPGEHDKLEMLLCEHAIEFRQFISRILEKEKKKYTLELSRTTAAAFHFYWEGQPIPSYDAGQAVNCLLGVIDQWRKSPQRLIPEIS